MQLRAVLVACFALVLAAACAPEDRNPGGGGDDDQPGPPGGGFVDGGIDPTPPTEECDKIDFLFVVDDSGSMGEEQTNLKDNFPQFVQVIDSFMTASGAPIDYRIAITTTGRTMNWMDDPPPVMIPGFPTIDPPATPMSQKGPDGALIKSADCGMSKNYVERADGNAATTFACAAKVGVSGAAAEMPLYVTKLALKDRVADGKNAGFLRDDALLAIIMLTDENDCSREDNNFTITDGDVCSPASLAPVPSYITFLDQLKGARGRWAAAVIAGDGDCSSSFGEARDATRLKEFVQQTGTNAVFSSICAGNLSGALTDALETFDAACANFPPVD